MCFAASKACSQTGKANLSALLGDEINGPSYINSSIHTTYGTAHRIGTEAYGFDYERAVTHLKQYIYAYSKRKFDGQLDIVLTFTKDDIDNLDKE